MYAITHIENMYFQRFFHIFTAIHKATVIIKQTACKNSQYGNLFLKEKDFQFFTFNKLSVISEFLNIAMIQSMH